MNEEEYLKNRVDDQINWYDKKSTTNKKLHNYFQISEIGLSLLIPLCAGFNTPELYYINYIIALLGFLVAGIAGIMNHFKFKEKWTEYRTVAESIKQEKYLFITNAGIYKSENSFETFVESIEKLISQENTNWVQHVNDSKKEKLSKKVL